MHIRCERCATLYELDESLLAPEGSPVQCAKCDHVFTASPPRAAEPRSEPCAEPLPDPRPEVLAEPPAAAVDDAPEAPPSSPVSAGSSGSAGGARALADWDSAPPVYRGSPPVGLRSPLLRQNPVGAFESRLRWMARARWLIPTVAVAALAVGGGTFWLVRARLHSVAERTRADRAASSQHDAGHRPGGAPSSASPATAGPEVAPLPAGPAGNEEPSTRKAAALHAPPSRSPSPAPGHPAAGDASAAGDGAPAASSAPAPAPPTAPATQRRKRIAGPLAPAALPELAPASAAPVVEPRALGGAAPEPRTESAVQEPDTGGGG